MAAWSTMTLYMMMMMMMTTVVVAAVVEEEEARMLALSRQTYISLYCCCTITSRLVCGLD